MGSEERRTGLEGGLEGRGAMGKGLVPPRVREKTSKRCKGARLIGRSTSTLDHFPF